MSHVDSFKQDKQSPLTLHALRQYGASPSHVVAPAGWRTAPPRSDGSSRAKSHPAAPPSLEQGQNVQRETETEIYFRNLNWSKKDHWGAAHTDSFKWYKNIWNNRAGMIKENINLTQETIPHRRHDHYRVYTIHFHLVRATWMQIFPMVMGFEWKSPDGQWMRNKAAKFSCSNHMLFTAKA